MKNFNHKLIATALVFGLCQSAFSQLTPENIWVTFENESDVPELVEGKLQSSNQEVQNIINEFNISSVEQALPDSRKESLLKVYDVTCLCDADDLSERITSTSTVLTKPEDAPKYELLSAPNDYDVTFTEDYALDLIDAKGAWDYSTGDPNTILGISDGNFFTSHEELESKYVGINTYPSSTYYYYHGTAVATTAAGSTDNGAGKSSIGYNCKLDLVSMNYSLVLQLSYNGARVINLSWSSGCSYSSYVQAVIDEVYENGTIIVAAAGNGGTCGGPSNLVYPAASDHVIAVSSIGPWDNHERTIGDPTATHQHNSSVDICAPGYDVALTVSPGWYLLGNGTSFAAPYVTGTIGLMLSENPCLSFEEVQEILQTTAVDIDALNPNYAGQLGAGRLNAKEALRLAIETTCGGYNDNSGTGTTTDTTGTTTGTNGTGTGVGTGTTGPSMGADCEGCTDTHISNPPIKASDSGSSRMIGENNTIEASVYPNPTSNSATVLWSINENMTLYVTDLNGIIIDQQEITEQMNKTTVNLENRGLYFIRLVNENQQIWLKKLVRM